MKQDPGQALQDEKISIEEKNIRFNPEGAAWVYGTVFPRDAFLTLGAQKTKAWCDARERKF